VNIFIFKKTRILMNKKTILFSANTSWNIYNFRMGAMIALKNAGHRVVVVSPIDEYAQYIKDTGFEFYGLGLDNDGVNPFKDALALLRYLKVYVKIKPDLIFHFTIKPCVYGGIVSGILGYKNISVITGLGYAFINNTLVSKAAWLLYKISLKFADEVWFQNRDDLNEFIKLSIINKSKKISILPGSGINTEKFNTVPSENSNGKFSFLLIARILWDKGVGEYIEAAKKVKSKHDNVEFVLLGSLDAKNPKAIQKDMVFDWVKDGIIKYPGTTDDVMSYIAKSDCVVLPSYREGVPRSLLEAASMQKPIVATDVPGCREIVKDGVNGFLCMHKNYEDLAEKLEKILMCSDEERRKMGQKGREIAIGIFDESIIIKKYIDTVSSLNADFGA
jgi:glycosyltransferase involved in cell wall biosynthesis